MVNIFPHFPNIIAKISERSDGSMKLFNGTDVNMENRDAFFRKIGINPEKVVGARIAHGTNVAYVEDASLKIIPDVDVLVSDKKDLFLLVTIADCIPIFFYESGKNIIALAHAGWRGVAGEIAKKAVNSILERGGVITNIHVALGPGIGVCHFEVREDAAKEFKNYPDCIEKRDEKIFIDLKKVLKKQCDMLGIKREAVSDIAECTFCQAEKYFSFRRDKPEVIEAMAAGVGVK